jgi:hypothetical protein
VEISLTRFEALSQVVFVEEHIQRVFQDERLSITNSAQVGLPTGICLLQGQRGFADALASLVVPRAQSTDAPAPDLLRLCFDGGVQLRVPNRSSVSGTEAFVFIGRGERVVVEHNA